MKKLLYFFAPWCNHCEHANKETITPLERKVGKRKIERINVELEPHMADLHNIDKVPTTIIISGGAELFRRAGTAIEVEELEALLIDKNKKRRNKNIKQ